MKKPTAIFLGFFACGLIHLCAAESPLPPSGPKGPGRLGAYQTTLKYDPAWDNPWRIGDEADVVVRFDDGWHRFVFWRGTSYIPHWVTNNDIWYNNEFIERSGNADGLIGCIEPMSDKQCRYSHVRVLESNDACVVADHPIVNPSFVVKNLGDREATLEINGREIRRGKDFRCAFRHTLEGSDLIVWIKQTSTNHQQIVIR